MRTLDQLWKVWIRVNNCSKLPLVKEVVLTKATNARALLLEKLFDMVLAIGIKDKVDNFSKKLEQHACKESESSLADKKR